jgi:uncharacterized protein YjcR
MSKRQAYYEDCRMLYVRNNDLGTIAEATGVSVTTLSKWKAEGSWENQRKEYNRHPLAMAEKIDRIMGEIVDKIVAAGGQITAEQADQLSKLAAVKKTLASAEDLPSMIIYVTGELSKFIRQTVKDEELAEKFSLLLADFYKQVKEANFGQ